jgi:hypothetical protein
LISLPVEDVVDAAALPSVSGSPVTPDRGGGGAPGGGFIIMAWVITLLTALIELMLSYP